MLKERRISVQMSYPETLFKIQFVFFVVDKFVKIIHGMDATFVFR